MSSEIELLTQRLAKTSMRIALAESCTGGSLAAQLTRFSGSSVYFDRAYVTYSDQAKIDMLGVERLALERFGAVSEVTAMQMVRGVVRQSGNDIGVAITGIAGPTGGSQDKPVGRVCFGFYIRGKYWTTVKNFKGARQDVINQSITFVCQTLIQKI